MPLVRTTAMGAYQAFRKSCFAGFTDTVRRGGRPHSLVSFRRRLSRGMVSAGLLLFAGGLGRGYGLAEVEPGSR